MYDDHEKAINYTNMLSCKFRTCFYAPNKQRKSCVKEWSFIAKYKWWSPIEDFSDLRWVKRRLNQIYISWLLIAMQNELTGTKNWHKTLIKTINWPINKNCSARKATMCSNIDNCLEYLEIIATRLTPETYLDERVQVDSLCR